MTNPIDEFARKLIEAVRDDTIAGCDVLKNPWSRAPMRLQLNKFDRNCVNKVLELLIPDLIDDTIFHLLRSIDGGEIRLVYVSDDGASCDLGAEGMGELAGSLWGEEGWIARYSAHQSSE